MASPQIGKDVGLIWLDGTQPGKMGKVASFVRHITPSRLGAAQFPNPVQGRKGKVIHCPAEWMPAAGGASGAV